MVSKSDDIVKVSEAKIRQKLESVTEAVRSIWENISS